MSKIKKCMFCGTANCENCLYKERAFPRATINAGGKKKKGEICKVCDRKFFIRQMTMEQAMGAHNLHKVVKALDT